MGTYLQVAFFAYPCKHWGHVKSTFLPNKKMKKYFKKTLKTEISVPYICKGIEYPYIVI